MTIPLQVFNMRDVAAQLTLALAVVESIDTLSAIKIEEALLRVRQWLEQDVLASD